MVVRIDAGRRERRGGEEEMVKEIGEESNSDSDSERNLPSRREIIWVR